MELAVTVGHWTWLLLSSLVLELCYPRITVTSRCNVTPAVLICIAHAIVRTKEQGHPTCPSSCKYQEADSAFLYRRTAPFQRTWKEFLGVSVQVRDECTLVGWNKFYTFPIVSFWIKEHRISETGYASTMRTCRKRLISTWSTQWHRFHTVF